MAKFIEVQIQGTDEFYNLLNAIVLTGKRSAKDQAKTHFKGVVRNMLALTFPMGSREGASLKLNSKGQHTGSIDFTGGKKAGEIAIKNDLNKAFMTPQQAKALKKPLTNFAEYKNESPQTTLTWYLSVRNKRKRISRSLNRAVTGANKSFVFQQLKKRQGYVAAGWIKAASQFGIALPSWISSQSFARSTCKIDDAPNFFYITAICGTNHPNANVLQSRAAIAMNMQANNMKRILTAALKDAQKKKGVFTNG
jgi:hypothetical protein